MKSTDAAKLFSNLGNETRITIYRILVKAGNPGLTPSEILAKIDIAPNKLTFHLNNLSKENLLNKKKEGRNIIYSVNFPKINELIDYLFEKCCSQEKK